MRFHVVSVGDGDVVLGLVAHELVLDLRSVYAVLGAVVQAYLGRFRAETVASVEPEALAEPVSGRALASRRAWWADRLGGLPQAARLSGPGPDAGRHSTTLRRSVAADRWARLASSGSTGGNTPSLATIALVAWWLHRHRPGSGPPVFVTWLDLREYLGLGPVIGSLSDRVVLAVDAPTMDDLTFGELLMRTHAAVLDAAVHYVPYGELVDLGVGLGLLRPQRPAEWWDLAVHYCRLPPQSAQTRGEKSLVDRGLWIELFAEVDLACGPPAVGSAAWDGGNVDLHVGEDGDDMVIALDVNSERVRLAEADRLLEDLLTAIDTVATDPLTRMRGIRPVVRTLEPTREEPSA